MADQVNGEEVVAAAGLPDKVMLAVTPNRVYAFKLGFRGRDHKFGGEVGSWGRAGLKLVAVLQGAAPTGR